MFRSLGTGWPAYGSFVSGRGPPSLLNKASIAGKNRNDLPGHLRHWQPLLIQAHCAHKEAFATHKIFSILN